jgi:hypothetical protein
MRLVGLKYAQLRPKEKPHEHTEKRRVKFTVAVRGRRAERLGPAPRSASITASCRRAAGRAWTSVEGVPDMQWRRLILLATLVLSAAALSACRLPPPEPLHPVKGTTSGTAIIDSATGTGTSDGPFDLTVLGKGTLHNDFTSSTQTGNTTTLTGAAIWSTRAESHAAVLTTFTTTVTGTSTGLVATTVNTITGGTGRFKDASGTMTVTSSSVTVSTVGSVTTSTFTSTVQGQISF